MNEIEFKKLMDELFVSKTGIGWTIPGDQNRKDVEAFIRKHFFESESAKKIAIMEAKIFAYEQIISKSNFSPILNAVTISDPNIAATVIPELEFKCDVCGHHPSILIRTEKGIFCQEHSIQQ